MTKKYCVERDADLRAYEFYEDAPSDRDPCVIASGVDMRVRDKDGSPSTLHLQKVLLPDPLIRFILNNPLFERIKEHKP